MKVRNKRKDRAKSYDTLPKGTNPLAVRVGKLCKLYRTARGFSVERAAESLCIDTGVYVWIERGIITPWPSLAQRIGQWLLDKIDFDGVPLAYGPGGTKHEWGRDGSEKAISVYLGRRERQILRRRAALLGLTIRDLVTIYVRRGLLSETTYATLAEAKQELEDGRARMVLAESPALRAALEAELRIIARSVEPTTHIRELEPMKVPLQETAKISTKDVLNTKDLLTSEVEERI
jgi:transcriptional regulator with XRE-family HTH domain